MSTLGSVQYLAGKNLLLFEYLHGTEHTLYRVTIAKTIATGSWNFRCKCYAPVLILVSEIVKDSDTDQIRGNLVEKTVLLINLSVVTVLAL